MVLSDFYQDLEDQEFEDSDGEAQMYMDALERIAQDENLDDDVDFDYDDEDEDEDEDYVPDDDEDDEPSYTYLRVDPDDSDDASVDETATGSHPLLEIMALLNSGSGLSDSARSALFNRIARSGRASFGNTPQYRPDTISGRLFEPQTEADPRGVKLLQSGDFGATGPWRSGGRLRPSERRGKRRYMRDHVANHAANPVIPNTHGTIVAEYPGVRAYLGQYAGPDYGMFYSATQDFQLHLYDTTKSATEKDSAPIQRSDDDETYSDMWGHRHYRKGQLTSLKQLKTVRGVFGQWTITDAHADRNVERMIYSSITPVVHMFKTAEHDEEHVSLDFRSRPFEQFGIWSLRFSADGKEIVAGTSRGGIMVYDIEAEQRILKVVGHNIDLDVNSVCFADTASTNILVSGSDDGYIKVWDRRSLSQSRPSGVLPGATQGITYISPKGDGRYIVANSKDQAARLYDLRKMRSWNEFQHESDAVDIYGDTHFDYRNGRYRVPEQLSHPRDCSVMTYRGHSVLRTLIRCHFSPVESTGQRYIYSGSADGLIHIWSLDGQVVQVLDRSETAPLSSGGVTNDPSAPQPRPRRVTMNYLAAGNIANTVRDVSWHGYEPTLMSTCWEAGGRHSGGGTVAKHEWKGLGKGGLRSLEDWVGKNLAEARHERYCFEL